MQILWLITMSWASSPAARPAPLVPAHDSTSDRILFCVLRLLPFRPRRAPPCPPRRATPRPCALTGDGSRTVKTRSVPIVSQATPLSLCLAANNAHPMLHQIFSSLPSFCHRSLPARERLPTMGSRMRPGTPTLRDINRTSGHNLSEQEERGEPWTSTVEGRGGH